MVHPILYPVSVSVQPRRTLCDSHTSGVSSKDGLMMTVEHSAPYHLEPLRMACVSSPPVSPPPHFCNRGFFYLFGTEPKQNAVAKNIAMYNEVKKQRITVDADAANEQHYEVRAKTVLFMPLSSREMPRYAVPSGLGVHCCGLPAHPRMQMACTVGASRSHTGEKRNDGVKLTPILESRIYSDRTAFSPPSATLWVRFRRTSSLFWPPSKGTDRLFPCAPWAPAQVQFVRV